MSFSFRNLFSQGEDDGSSLGQNSQQSGAAEAADRQSENLFASSQEREGGSFEAMFGGSPEVSGVESGATERFAIRDLLSLIPPALATQESVAPGDFATLTLPADGSRTVKFSQIQAVCPHLFATEITPLNDSIMTLPHPHAAAPAAPAEANPFAVNQPAAAPSPAMSAAGVDADNPFWAPEPAAAGATPTSASPVPASAPAAVETASPFGFPSPKAPAAESESPFGFGTPATPPTTPPAAIENPFSAPSAAPAPTPTPAAAMPAAQTASPFGAPAPESAIPAPAAAAPTAKADSEGGFDDVFGDAPFGAGSPMSSPRSKASSEPDSTPAEIESPFGGMPSSGLGSAMTPPPLQEATGGFSFPGVTEPAEPVEPKQERPAPAPVAKPKTAQLVSSEESIEFSVRELLAKSPVHVTGVDPETVPPAIVARIPRSYVEARLSAASGPVDVTIGQIISTLPEEQRGYLTQGNREAKLELPEFEIARQLRGEGEPPAPAPAPAPVPEPAAFDTPFALQAKKDVDLTPKPAASFPVEPPSAPATQPPALTPAKAPSPTPWDQPSPPKAADLSPAPAKAEDAGSTFFNSTAATAGLSAAGAPAGPIQKPASVPSAGSLDDIPASLTPQKPQVSVSVERREGEASVPVATAQPRISVSTTPALPVSESKADPKPAASAPDIQAGPSIGEPIPECDVMRDIELRAVFGEGGDFTLDRIAKLTVDLKGIDACAIASRKGSAHAEKPNAAGFAEVAGSLVDSAREIAKLMGMADAETFTMRTARGVASFFLHEEVLLTVQHAEGEFDPGVREKLILITRGLTALVKR